MWRVGGAALASLLMAALPASAEAALFGPPTTFATAAGSSEQVAAGDFNLDTKPDLAVVNTGNPGNVTILLGDGAGGFTQAAGSPYSVGQSPTSIAVADLNNDGKPDFVASNFIGASLSIYLGDGAGGFTQASGSPVAATGGNFYVATGDFNSDGLVDLATANSSNGSVGIYVGTGNGGFVAAPGSPFPDGGTFPDGLAVGDLNGDGRLDIAVANHTSSTVSVLLGSGSAGTVGFLPAVGSPFSTGIGASGPANIAIGDVNGDGRPDLATANDSSNTASVFVGNGLGRLTALPGSPFSVPNASNPLGVALGDLNGDGRADVAIAKRGTPQTNGIAVLLSTGNGMVAAPDVVVSSPDSVLMSDLNGDGRLDLATAQFLSPGGSHVVLNTAAAVASPSPPALAFGEQPATTIGDPHSIALSNTAGDIALKVSSVKVVGANADDFIKTTDDCDQATILPNGNCTVNVRFAPTAAGGRSAVLRITDNAPGSPHDVALNGSGVAAPTTGPGPAGATGQTGATGMTGVTGATGPQGARGPRGRDARVTCKLAKPKKRGRKQRIVCTVRFAAPASSRAVARLTRNGRVYASGRVTVGRATPSLRLHARRALRAGRYRLTLTVIDRGATVRTVRSVTVA